MPYVLKQITDQSIKTLKMNEKSSSYDTCVIEFLMYEIEMQ